MARKWGQGWIDWQPNRLSAKDWLGSLRLRMIEIVRGDLLEAKVEALVNAVNVMGVMGAGIALQFREKYPEMFKAYARTCKSAEVVIGKMHVFDLGDSEGDPRCTLHNFSTPVTPPAIKKPHPP